MQVFKLVYTCIFFIIFLKIAFDYSKNKVIEVIEETLKKKETDSVKKAIILIEKSRLTVVSVLKLSIHITLFLMFIMRWRSNSVLFFTNLFIIVKLIVINIIGVLLLI